MWGDEDVGAAPVRTARRSIKAKTRTPSIVRHHSAGAADGISPAVPSAAAALTRAMPERSLSEQPSAPQRQQSWGESSSDDDASLPAFHGAESRDGLAAATDTATDTAADDSSGVLSTGMTTDFAQGMAMFKAQKERDEGDAAGADDDYVLVEPPAAAAAAAAADCS